MTTMRLYKRDNGKWYVEIKRGLHKSMKTTDEKLARRVFAAMEREQLHNRLVIIEKGELVLLQTFIDEYLSTRRDRKPATQKADRLALNHLLDYYGNKPMRGISAPKLAEFMAFMMMKQVYKGKDEEGQKIMRPITKDAVNLYIRHLRKALKTAQEWGYLPTSNKQQADGRTITADPLKNFKQYRVSHRVPHYADKPHVKALLDAAGQYRHKCMQTAIALQYFTGMGRSEVMGSIAIGPESITWKRVKTNVPKTESISDVLRPYLAHLSLGIQRILPWRNLRTYNEHFAEVVKAAALSGMGLSPHKMRHILADHLLNAGEDLKTVSEILGHSSINVTAESYAHLRDATKKTALNKLGNWEGK